MQHVDKDELRKLLELWQTGKLTEREVHEEAEFLWGRNRQWPEYPRDNPQSIILEILLNLESLNVQSITVEDIPVMLNFLNTPVGEELAGWQAWEQYWDNMDFEQRRLSLLANPYYAITPFAPRSKNSSNNQDIEFGDRDERA